jgi:ribosomal protein L33
MANVRQLPELYLRGALANITMKSLTKRQREDVNNKIQKIASMPCMAGCRAKLAKDYKNTIGQDFNEPGAIDAEFMVAIYKGVVSLLHHHTYTFKCSACKKSQYITKRGKPNPIDRVQTPCPNCKKVKVTNPGTTTLQTGQCVTLAEFQDSYKHHKDNDGNIAPEYDSTIRPVKGKKKYHRSEEISMLNDEKQIVQFFGTFVSNYFRQQILENQRTTHKKQTTKIMGTASQAYTQSLATNLTMDGIDNVVLPEQNGKQSIRLNGLILPLETTIKINEIVKEAKTKNATVVITNTEITLEGGEETATEIVTQERVSVLVNGVRIGNENDNAVDLVNHRLVRGSKMCQEDHVTNVDTIDAITKIKDSLPDGHHKSVFDIISQQGDTYYEYSRVYGDSQAKMNHIADFLDINTKQVGEIMNRIRATSIMFGLTPPRT